MYKYIILNYYTYALPIYYIISVMNGFIYTRTFKYVNNNTENYNSIDNN